MNRKYFITTAIDYVNALPHLGTAYEKIGADVMARYKRMAGYDVFFLMGVDEHSANVAKQAKIKNLDTKTYCDQMALEFQKVWDRLDIKYDRFIRTTDGDHIKSVRELFRRINEKGDIYKGKYAGWYCVSCERFYLEKELADSACPTHKTKPQWLEEENYFFRLSAYEKRLLEHIEKNPQFIEPEIRRNEIVNVIKGGLEDISVSRSTEIWGIPVPFDEKHVVYVWFDALINYITGAGFPENKERFAKLWPADVHVIGKDITRFHCVIWPAMLMAADISVPSQVFGHGFVYLSGEKMSKTAGTALDPVGLAQKYGPDPLRYYLMREIPFDRDGDFVMENYEQRYQSDLANDWGNLIQRTLSMINKYRDGKIYFSDGFPNQVVDQWRDFHSGLLETMEDDYNAMRFNIVLAKIWQLIQLGNRFVDMQAPWKLYKQDKNSKELDFTLYTLAEMIRIANILIYPVMPSISTRVQAQLNIDYPVTVAEAALWGRIPSGHSIGQIEPLFPKIEA